MNGTGAGKNGDREERGSLIRYGRALRRIAALLLFCLPFAGTALAEQMAGDFGTVGQTVTFGRYEQDYNAENGAEPIEWIVLDAREGKSLLLSRYALDTQPLDEGWEYNTTVHWRDCSLRAWLNGTFLDSAFGSGAKESILPTILVNDWEDGESPETEDRVFLLSRAEGTEYLGDEEEAWACMPTRKSTRVSLRGLNYQMPQYGSLDDMRHEGYGWWWLRSGGPSSPIGAHVYEQGRHAYRGTIPPFYRFVTVRPALWVDAEKAAGLDPGPVRFVLKPSKTHLFEKETGTRIRIPAPPEA